MMAKKKNTVISQHGKRIALRSPLAIESFELILDAETDELVLNMLISNISSEESPSKVESAGLVIRCLDSEGNLIVSSGREIISKTLKFPEEGLLPGASVGIKTKVDLDPELVSDVDIYIGCIRTLDLMVTDFVRGDFFDEPSDPIPLSEGMSDSEIYEVCEKVGDFAAYYPIELSSLVWRCTCGQMSDSENCPMCGTGRKQLFDYFSKFKYPEINTSRTEKARKRTRLFIALFSGIFLAATIALVISLVFFLPKLLKTDDNKIDKPDDSITEVIPEETLEEKEARINTLLEENEFTAALEVATSHDSLSKYVTAISESAVEYYLKAKEYDIAYAFAATCKNTENTEKAVLSAGYDYFFENSMLDKAMSYAKLLGDREKINTIHIININALVSEKKFSDAVKLAIDAELDAKKEEVVVLAIKQYSSVNDYMTSLDFAFLSNDEKVLTDLALEASYYYLGKQDIENTLKFSKYATDENLMIDIATGISDKHLLENLGTFFKYLPFSKKQEIHATKVSLNKQVAIISSDGTVFYGLGQKYTPEKDVKAISVKSSAHHTVILLSDGSVIAFGDNSFGQCNVDLWSDVVAIDVGEYHTVALLADGSVKACGNRKYSQCSVSSYKNVIMISAGDYHTMVLLENGSVLATGLNTDGQCNTSTWSDIVMIAAGSMHSVGVKSDGSAVAVGSNILDCCDITSWKNVAMISAGSTHTVAITNNGNILSAGGVVGKGSYGDISFDEKITFIQASNSCIVAVTNKGKLIFTGDGLPYTDHIKNQTVDPYCFFTSGE
ncbi:MAG: hypothetical protein E7633_02435 [Ruminococcaceae bacterium]|nr:hypothetical protein [Oscillospiraceae bacterium]